MSPPLSPLACSLPPPLNCEYPTWHHHRRRWPDRPRHCNPPRHLLYPLPPPRGYLPVLFTTLPCLVEFNTSNNKLYRRVLNGMCSRFETASFFGNAGLCDHTPLLLPCLFMPRKSPPSSSSFQLVVPSNTSSRLGTSSNVDGTVIEGRGQEGGRRNEEGLSKGSIVDIAIENVVFLPVRSPAPTVWIPLLYWTPGGQGWQQDRQRWWGGRGGEGREEKEEGWRRQRRRRE